MGLSIFLGAKDLGSVVILFMAFLLCKSFKQFDLFGQRQKK